MASNKRKVLLPDTMGRQGIDIVRAREDIETILFPSRIDQATLLPMLTDCAGIALGGTPFRRVELDAKLPHVDVD